MNVQHTKRGTEWLDLNQRNQEPKPAATTNCRRKSNSGKPCQGWHLSTEFQSIVIYYAVTLSIFPLFYGSSGDVYAGSYNLAAYFLVCALVPLFCMTYISIKLLLASQNANHITKALSVIYFALVVNNVVMAIDAVDNLEQWIALDFMDTLINGNSDWLIPLGIADALLIPIGVICLLSRFVSLGD